MDNGYVLLHRKLFSNRLWLSEKFTRAQAWVDLFANANHADGVFFVRGNEVRVKRGQLGWSIENMAQRWRWNRKTVMRFLSGLEQGHQIGQQRTHLTTIITIVNYDKYQKAGTTERTSKGTPEWTPEGTQTKNVKEELKNDKEEHMSATADGFSSFWAIYPKKEQKKKAHDVWVRKKLDSHLPVIIEFIHKAAETDRWKKGYIKMPTAFLTGECWNDDLTSYQDMKFNSQPNALIL